MFFIYYAALKISEPGPLAGFSLVWPVFGLFFWALFFAGDRIRIIARKCLLRNRVSKIVCGTVAAAFLAISAGLLCYICIPVSDDGVMEPEYLLVLGGGIRENGEPSATLLLRLDKAAEYIRKHPSIVVIVSGGKFRYMPWAESYAMAKYLKNEAGLIGTAILEEDRSLDTVQGFAYTLELVREREKTLHKGRNLERDPPRVCILTSGYHLKRAIFLAHRTGYAATSGLAAPCCPPVLAPANYLREVGAWWKLGIRLLLGGLPEARISVRPEKSG